MLKFLALIALLAVVAADPLGFTFRSNTDGRIIGGEDTIINQAPHQVSLEVYGGHGCGGTIISDTWIITAAHCAQYPELRYNVRAGSTYHNEGGSYHKVVEIINHKDYGTDKYGHIVNDIALLRVAEPFVLGETHRAIKLFKMGEVSTPGAMATISGWGTTSNGYTVILQSVQVPIISKEDCNSNYGSKGGIPDGEICAAYPQGGKDSCQGDSGGPLTIDGRLAGVVSWGYGCAVAGQPGVYTEIASYRAWIRQHSGV